MARFTYSGNEVEVYLDGIKADLLQNISGSDGYGHQPASGIGDVHVQEHVPGMATHSITIDKMVLLKEPFIAKGVILENGDAALRGRTFSIEVFSKPSGNLLKKYTTCVNDGGRVSIAAHRIVVSDATFLATDTVGDLAVQPA